MVFRKNATTPESQLRLLINMLLLHSLYGAAVGELIMKTEVLLYISFKLFKCFLTHTPILIIQ